MKRHFALATLFLTAALGSVLAQGGSSDTVRYRGKDGIDNQKIGEVKESVSGVVIPQAGGKNVTVPANEIQIVIYGTMPGMEDRDRQAIPGVETKGGPEAKAFYTELQKRVSTNAAVNERTRRFVDFRLAMWTAKIADTKTGDEFRAEANDAVLKLKEVAKAAKTWEVWPAYRTAARLQAELGKFTDADQTLAALAKVEGLPVELQNEAKLAQAEVLLRSGSALAAEPALQAAAKITNLSPAQKEKLAVFHAVQKAAANKTDPAKVDSAAVGIADQIDKITDPATKAASYNALGELFLMANMNRKAMWEFLRVEAVYNTDRDEVAKALERLAEIFEKNGEKERAAVYREKLVKAKGS